MLVLSNLIPAFPMDGGRVLRALLATQLGHLQATELAVWIGTGVAVFVGLAGFFLNPWMIIIAPIVIILGRQELLAMRYREALRRAPPIDVLPADMDLLQSRYRAALRQAAPLDVLPADEHIATGPTSAAAPAVLEFVWDPQAGGWVERRSGRPLSVFRV